MLPAQVETPLGFKAEMGRLQLVLILTPLWINPHRWVDTDREPETAFTITGVIHAHWEKQNITQKHSKHTFKFKFFGDVLGPAPEDHCASLSTSLLGDLPHQELVEKYL